jgi:Pyruvate-formate lyase-activating enzyme
MSSLAPRWWSKESGDDKREFYRCNLCFRRCRLEKGRMGHCGVRGVGENGFISPALGYFTACAVDPIEKKPLYHWRPGSRILSLGSLGCTMDCPFCQNHRIAHPGGREVPADALSPEQLLSQTLSLGLDAVAYTYNEPALMSEFILEAGPILNEAGIAAVLVTNGLFSREVLDELSPWVDAANVDVKSFNPQTYSRLGGDLGMVKGTVEYLINEGIHVELTTLVVPGLNDDPEEFAALCDWAAALSPELPLHISRYFPAWKYDAPPTDPDLLRRFQKIAAARLKFTHLGNL